jgi:Flp pilus assembly protein TadG
MLLKRFLANRDASVAPMLALAALPLFGFVGAAIDYSRAAAVRTDMQAAADGTALMLSKDASSSTSSDLQTKADNYFQALFTRTGVNNLTVGTNYASNTGGSEITLTVTASVPTNRTENGDQQSTCPIAEGGVQRRRRLCVDHSVCKGRQRRSQQLQRFVDLLGRLGCDQGTLQSSYTTESSCVANGKVWTPKSHSTWNGCITDRGNSGAPSTGAYDTNVIPPNSGVITTQFPAEQYGSCPQAIMPLSYNWPGMTTMVNNMAAAGNTNQAIVHGWQSLVGGGPYPTPPAMDPNFHYKQVMVLLTDGLNTQDRW